MASAAASVSVHHIVTAGDLEALLGSNPDKMVAVKFTAAWCGPCKRIAPVFKQTASKLKAGMVAAEVDVDNKDSEELVKRYRIEAMPTFMFMRANQVVFSMRGANEGELVNAMALYSQPRVQCDGCKREVQQPHHPLKWSGAKACVKKACESCAWPDESTRSMRCGMCTPVTQSK